LVLSLEPLDVLEGLFSVLIVTITTTVGILILLKYRNNKTKEFLYWGIGFVGIFSPYWPSALSFLIVIISQSEALAITNMCLYVGIWVVPSIFFLLMWMSGFFELVNSEKKKLGLLIITIISITVESLLIYYMITGQCNELAELDGLFDCSFEMPVTLWLLFIAFTVSITGLLVGINALKAGKRSLKIKGIFLNYSFIVFPIAGIIDGGMKLDTTGVMIIRIITLSCAFTFYVGMFMPKFMKNLLKIED